MDLFVVPTIGFELFYAFVIVRLDRRDLVWINVTRNPTAEWVARQITEAFPWDEAPKYLIRDRDRIYGTIVTRRLRAMGVRDKPTAPASPWQNGLAERLIGSIRRESLDHIVVFCEAHLRRSLRSYARYYNDMRTHRSRPVHSADFIITTPGFRFSVHTQGPAPDTKPKLRFLSSELAPHYSPTYSPIGRPSIDPEPMIRMPPTGHGVL